MFTKLAIAALAFTSSALAAPAPAPEPEAFYGYGGSSGYGYGNSYGSSGSSGSYGSSKSNQKAAAPIPTVTTTIYTTTGTAALSTTTTVSGGTLTYQITVPTACGNGGMDFGVYANPFAADPSNKTYGNFDPAYFWNKTPDTVGVTPSLAFRSDSASYGITGADGRARIYNTTTGVSPQQFVVMHHAYLYAQEAGTYTFQSYNADEYTGLFLNTYAIRDYMRGPRATMEHCHGDNVPMKQYTVNLSQGQYLPFRVIYANGGAGALFNYTIIHPNGKRIVDYCSWNTAPYVVRSSCNGVPIFPPFRAWGNEQY